MVQERIAGDGERCEAACTTRPFPSTRGRAGERCRRRAVTTGADGARLCLLHAGGVRVDPRPKLSPAAVLALRAFYARLVCERPGRYGWPAGGRSPDGLPALADFARAFGVSEAVVSEAARGHTYAGVHPTPALVAEARVLVARIGIGGAA